jgi:cytochrome c
VVKKLGWMGLAALLACLAFLATAAVAVPPPSSSAQEKQVKALVKSAAKLIKKKGEAAFAELNVKNGPWHKGATAIFVGDDKGLELVNAAAPELVGKNLWDFKDPDGKLVIQEEWKIIKAKGKGWLECKWAKPGTTQPVPCRSYVQGVKYKGKQYMVGAAYYPE